MDEICEILDIKVLPHFYVYTKHTIFGWGRVFKIQPSSITHPSPKLIGLVRILKFDLVQLLAWLGSYFGLAQPYPKSNNSLQVIFF